MNCRNNRTRRKIFIIPIYLLAVLFFQSVAQAQTLSSIAVSELKPGDSIYVITNREVDTTRETLSFSHEINENASLSFVKVRLSPTLELESESLNYSDFMDQVCAKAADWLFFVHGDGKTYHESVERGLIIQNTYNVNVIVFSWPSEVPDINGLKNFKNSQSNVLKSIHHFNELLVFTGDFKKRNQKVKHETKLSMFLHSLGNLYLKRFIEGSENQGEHGNTFENIIMNSAAVNRENHKEWVEKISLQKNIYVTNNHYDFSLKGLHLYTKHGNQLGEEFNGAMAKNVNYIHFTEAIGFQTPTSNTHTYFIGDIPRQSENIKRFYYDAFHSNQIELADTSRFVKRENGLSYDIVF